jgi:hypothetical protein
MVSLMELYLAKPHPHITSSIRVMILSLISCVFLANGARAFSAFGISDPAGWATWALGIVVGVGIWWERRRKNDLATGNLKKD